MPKRGRGRPRKGKEKEVIPLEEAEFFKVFLPHLGSDKLQIPPDFVKDFHKTIKERIKLKVAGNKVWQIDVLRNRKGVFLTNGWTRFVSGHGVEAGDFLVFKYDKCYTFTVDIFGINGCKKDPLAANDVATTHIKIEDSEEEPEEKQPRCKSARRDSKEETEEKQPRRKSARLA